MASRARARKRSIRSDMPFRFAIPSFAPRPARRCCCEGAADETLGGRRRADKRAGRDDRPFWPGL